MPHIVLEYFTDTPPDLQRMLSTALEVAAASGIMQREDIKVRALRSDAILFGDGRRSFLHVTVSLLAGRSAGAKLSLAEALTTRLRQAFPEIEAISADIRDMDPTCYKKSLATRPDKGGQWV